MDFMLTTSIQYHSKFTISHLEKEPLEYLTSEELVDFLKALERFLGDRF